MTYRTICTAVALALAFPGASWAQGNAQPYTVIINHEEQYSVWPVDMAPEKGWRAIGPACRLEDCITRIEEVWTDMRPLSIRRRVEQSLVRAAKLRPKGG